LRWLAKLAVDYYMPFAALSVMHMQRSINQLFSELPVTNDQREVIFLNPAFAKVLMKFT
jgi:hypothetical protein